jgi:hypothetical protein
MPAASEKKVFARTWLTHDRKLYSPGELLTGRMSQAAIESALENGEATDEPRQASEASGEEQARQGEVKRSQQERSRKREHNAAKE